MGEPSNATCPDCGELWGGGHECPPWPLDDRDHPADPRWHEPDRHERILNDITTVQEGPR